MFLYIGLAIVFLFLVVLFVGAAKVPKFNPENKNVIITGGSDGLGLELASQLAQKGANVIIIARDRKRLDGAVEQIKTGLKKSSQTIEGIVGDVANRESINDAITKAATIFDKRIDLLISNAGITRPQMFEELEDTWFERIMTVNYFGTVNVVRAVLPYMKKLRAGRIVSVGSVLSVTAYPGYSAYCGSNLTVPSLAFNIHCSLAIPASIGSANFYAEEQKLKPKVTLALEEDDPILPPKEVAKGVIAGIERWSFLISPSGFNTDSAAVLCAGLGPRSFIDYLKIVAMGPILNIACALLFHLKSRNIIYKHVK